MTRRALFIVLISVISISAFAQDVETQKVIPGKEYDAGFLHRLLFGSSWRELWNTPIEVQTLDLRTYDGGLRPTVRGNGFDAKSLRFKSGDGGEYLFRILNKDPRQIVPSELRESFVEGIAQDFGSASNPFAMLVTMPILRELGMHTSLYDVVMLPVDDKLGEFKSEFGGILGTLEENVSGTFISTESVFEKLDEDNHNYVDAVEFLKARMVDIYFGDWDRGVDKWMWESHPEGERTRYAPVPNDRAQAFSRYRGLVPFIVSQNVPHIESCEDTYPWIADLTWSGRHLDRRFLSSLEKPVWDSLMQLISSTLTDELIEESVKQLPPEILAKEGEAMTKMLRSRRDNFPKAIEECYANMSRYVDVWASDKSEYAEVSRTDDTSVTVSIYTRDKDNGSKKGKPFYSRVFNNNETREIRLHLQDGDDFAKVDGNVNGSILTRIVGGLGKDELVDSSNVRGYLGGILPIKTNKTKTIFYESGEKTEFVYGASTSIIDAKYVRAADDTLTWEPLYRDWGHEWDAFGLLSFTTDDGATLGAKAQLTNYSFRSVPYQNQMDLSFSYAIGAKRYKAVYDATFPEVWKGTMGLNVSASGLEQLNFYGFGNETSYTTQKAAANYYTILQNEYQFAPSYQYTFIENVSLRTTAALRYISTPLSELADSALMKEKIPSGTDDMFVTTLSASGVLDTRNSKNFPERGYYLHLSSKWTPEILDNRFAYTKAAGDVRLYFTAPLLGGITLAMRARGERIWGEFPYYDAVYLGGSEDLRGFARERFAGDASVFGSAELRVNLGKFNIVVPGHYGFTVAGESGKVFYKESISDVFHTSINWGVWIAPLSKENVVSLTVASSQERTSIILTGGFAF